MDKITLAGLILTALSAVLAVAKGVINFIKALGALNKARPVGI